MPLLGDLRNFFTRRKVVTARDWAAVDSLHAGEPTSGNLLAESPYEPGLAGIEPKLPLTVESLDREHPDTMSLLRVISHRLDEQDQNMARLLRLMESSRSTSNADESGISMQERLDAALKQAAIRDETLNAALTRVNESANRQTDVLGLIEQQIDGNRQTDDQLRETLNAMHTSLAELAESSRRMTAQLDDISQFAEIRDSRLHTVLERTRFWMVRVMLLCCAAAIVAIIVAVVSLTRS